MTAARYSSGRDIAKRMDRFTDELDSIAPELFRDTPELHDAALRLEQLLVKRRLDYQRINPPPWGPTTGPARKRPEGALPGEEP